MLKTKTKTGPFCIVSCLPILLWGVVVAALAQVPPRSDSGQTLRVTEADRDLGAVYHLWPGDDTQLLLVSRAPLQKVALSMSRMIGYVVTPFEPESDRAPILKGAFRIPVHSFVSSIQSSREILGAPDFFDVDRFPEIEIEFTHSPQGRRIGTDQEETRYEATLQAQMRVRGKPYPLLLPATIRLSPYNQRTMSRNVGDIAIIEGKATLDLEQLGWRPPDPAHREGAWVYFSLKDRIASRLSLEFYLMLNTVPPDRGPDLTFSWQRWVGLNPDQNLRRRDQLSMCTTLLRDLGDSQRGYSYARGLMAEWWAEAAPLHDLARLVLATGGIEQRNYSFALKAARRAAGLTHQRDPVFLETVARLYLASGEPDRALEWAGKARSHLPEGRDALRKRLEILSLQAKRRLQLERLP